jgi:hypothetical protein
VPSHSCLVAVVCGQPEMRQAPGVTAMRARYSFDRHIRRRSSARLGVQLILILSALTIARPETQSETDTDQHVSPRRSSRHSAPASRLASSVTLHSNSENSGAHSAATTSPWTRGAHTSTEHCRNDEHWVDAQGRSCTQYQDNPTLCPAAALYTTGGTDASDVCCAACTWFRIASMPATEIMHYRGHVLHQSGGVAGLEFDVQPSLNVSGKGFTVVEASLGNNPGCSSLYGNTVAQVVHGVAAFTDLWVDKAARGYSLKFCTGQCSSVEPWLETSAFLHIETAPFDIQPGKLHVIPGKVTPETGVPIGAEVEIQHITTYGGVRYLEAFTDYNFSLTVSIEGVTMTGRRTLWPVKGRVRFTDLIIEVATKSTESGFRLVYRSCFGASEEHCLPNFAQLQLTGQPMLAVSASFKVRHTSPSHVIVFNQPNSTLAGWALGSICENLMGPTCKKFKVTHPPVFSLVDRFENNVDTGSWFACATLLLYNSSANLHQVSL